MSQYKKEYKKSIAQKEEFWRQQAEKLEWFEQPKSILSQDENDIFHWFADGIMNTSYMAIDYHINQGRGDNIAYIYDSPVTNTIEKISYNELKNRVSLCAGMLKNHGIEKGDRVVIYMPMIIEAAICMLACARLGAIHCVVFGGFAAPELASRINNATPKAVLSASCGIEANRIVEYKPLLDEALKISTHKPQSCIIYQRAQVRANLIDGRDYDFNQELKKAKPADAVALRGDDLLYTLYTSGTTGMPKGVVRENGGHAVALKYSMKAIYDMNPGDVFWAASDVGWVVGHSYIVYAPLLAGCTSIFYEGKPVMTPDAGAFWRVISEHKVKGLFTAPTAFRAIKKEDSEAKHLEKYDISCLKYLFSAGERLDPPTYNWLTEKVKVPVIDNWWQTETGWPIASNITGIEFMPLKAGSATMPTPGFDIHILDDEGTQLEKGKQGNIAIKLPLPPCCLTSIWGDVNRFKSGYLQQFKGYYVSGDRGYFDEDDYLFVMGRTDDVINVAGHRFSTGEMEEIVGMHNAVAECAVIGKPDELKGQLPVALVVLKSGFQIEEKTLINELVEMVRKYIGAVACFKEVIVVSRLPKTRSGKILRKSIRQIAAKEQYAIPSTIEDPMSLAEIEALF